MPRRLASLQHSLPKFYKFFETKIMTAPLINIISALFYRKYFLSIFLEKAAQSIRDRQLFNTPYVWYMYVSSGYVVLPEITTMICIML